MQEEMTMTDVIIIGSGPAGLTAAIYARRAGFSVLVIEKAPVSGGQIMNTSEVDNYPGLPGIGGFEMGMKFREHAEAMQARFAEGVVEEIRADGRCWEVATQKECYQTRAVVIAAGAAYARLGAPGEEALRGHGVSYCATCDGAFFKGKVTAVIGGGDVAVEDAIYLSRFCSKVFVIHRRDKLRAARMLQHKLFSLNNVEMIWDSEAEEILGESRVEKIRVVNRKTGGKEELTVDGVFVAVGIRPLSEAFTSVVDTDENGYIIAGEDCITSTAGIFAAGDIRTKKLRQVITAAADGANAITSVEEYFLSLQEEG